MTQLIKIANCSLGTCFCRLACLLVLSLSISLPVVKSGESRVDLFIAMQRAWAAGDLRKCLAVSDKLIAMNSSEAEAYYYRGCVKSRMHDSLNAIKDLDYYCKHGKGPKIEALNFKIQCYVDTQQWTKALECIDQVNAVKPEASRYKTKAQIYRQLNDNKAAIKCLLTAVQLAPRDYWCWRELVSCYCNENLYKQALETSKHLVELRPDEPDGHGLRSKIYTKLGMPKEAKAELELCNKNSDFPF